MRSIARSFSTERKMIVAAATLGAALVSVPALALSVSTVNPGQTLNLSVTNAGLASSIANPGNGTISQLSGIGSYTYANAFSADQTGNPYSITTAGFYDDYVITVAAGEVDSISSTITTGKSSAITNLQVRLYDYTANGGVAPLLTTPVAGSAVQFWSTAFSIPSPVPGQPAISSTYDVLPTTTLAAGTYVIEVRGMATGTLGGNYSGTLNVTSTSAVPVPAALPLLFSGLGVFGVFGRRRARR